MAKDLGELIRVDKQDKRILTAIIIIVVVIIAYRVGSNWVTKIMEGKPNGPYHSSNSIDEAKKDDVWVATFSPTQDKYFSAKQTETYKLNEVWVEANLNNKNLYWATAEYKNILNIHFSYLTKNHLHKFRLIPNAPRGLDEYEQIETPDGYPRLRFLLNDFKDTIKLEVIERNPKDSSAWLTEKIIDTIVLVKKNVELPS